nr:esterase [uncultured bacterium]
MIKHFSLALASAVLLTGAAFADATETTVTYTVDGAKVVGTLSVPEGAPAPVVLLLHGFGGSRDELEIPSVGKGIFAYTAEKLADAGYASLRIDFRGGGDSDGKFEDTTYSGQIADGLGAIDFLKADASVDGSKIAVIGWSQGGLVASAVSGRSGVPVATALWAAVGEPEVTFSNLLGADKIAAGRTTGDTPLELPLPWGFSLYLKQAYFDEIATTKPLEEIAAFKGPLFVAEGTNDEVIALGTGEKFIAAHEGPEELFIRPMDHSFNVFTDTATLDELVASTIAFFKPYLAE